MVFGSPFHVNVSQVGPHGRVVVVPDDLFFSISFWLSFQRKCQGKSTKKYFTSSDPHHDMLGGGCQVRVVIENMMGRMENLRTLISGILGLVIY